MRRKTRRSTKQQDEIDMVSVCESEKENTETENTQDLLISRPTTKPTKFSALSAGRKIKAQPDKSQSTPTRKDSKENKEQHWIFEKIEKVKTPATSKKQLFKDDEENLKKKSPSLNLDIPISPIAVKKKRAIRKQKKEKQKTEKDEFHGVSYIDVMFKRIQEEAEQERTQKKERNQSGSKRKLNNSGNKSMNGSVNEKKPKRTSNVVDLTPEEIAEIENFDLQIVVVPKVQESRSQGEEKSKEN